MSNSIPLSDLESSASAKFDEIGDKHVGKITSIVERQQTDPKTNIPKTFPSGDPMMLWVITIEDADGDTSALYAKGGKFKAETGSGESMLSAIGSAVRAAGASSLDVGGTLAVAHTGLAKAEAGWNPAKLYTAQYQPPAPASVPVSDLFAS
jgi:hypothetical protein